MYEVNMEGISVTCNPTHTPGQHTVTFSKHFKDAVLQELDWPLTCNKLHHRNFKFTNASAHWGLVSLDKHLQEALKQHSSSRPFLQQHNNDAWGGEFQLN